LVVAEIRERLAVSRRAALRLDMKRLDLKKLNETEVKEKYQVAITNKFAALEILKGNRDINMAWDTIRSNIKF
jgi:hypothetical protein